MLEDSSSIFLSLPVCRRRPELKIFMQPPTGGKKNTTLSCFSLCKHQAEFSYTKMIDSNRGHVLTFFVKNMYIKLPYSIYASQTFMCLQLKISTSENVSPLEYVKIVNISQTGLKHLHVKLYVFMRVKL